MSESFVIQMAAATVGLMHLLMGFAAWLLLRGPRHAVAGRLWGAGAVAMGLSVLPAGLLAQLPDGLRYTVLPALLLLGLQLRVLALRRHMGRPLHLGVSVLLFGGLAACHVLCLQVEDVRVRLGFANAVFVVGTAVVGQHAWETGRATGTGHARWVALPEWLLTLALVVRALAIPMSDPLQAPVVPGWSALFALFAAGVAALYGHLGYLAMMLDDMHKAERQAREAQIAETTSREAAEQTAIDLQNLLVQRDELAEEREQLLQMLAHEIRQPLQNAGQAMQDALQVLRSPVRHRTTGVAGQLLGVQNVLGDVRSVLDNTLAAATLLSRGTPLVLQEVALDFLVDLTLGDLGAPQVSRVTVEWLTDLDSLEVEPGLVRLGLRNLLNNAFTHGGPSVEVRLRIEEDPASSTLRMSVADDGPGISPEQLLEPDDGERLPRRRLGLAIARQVMDLHGGQLLLSNTLPRGFLAQLVFPLPPDDWDDEASEAPSEDAPATGRSVDTLAEAAALAGRDDADEHALAQPAELAQAGTSGARNT